MDQTYNKKAVKASDHFKDSQRFMRTVAALKRQVGLDLLEEKNRLKTHVTALRKDMKTPSRK